MAKLSIILLVVSVIVIIPTLTLTILIARRLNNQDPYNKPTDNNNSMDRNFIWILAGLLLGFLLFCGAAFMFVKEKNAITNTQLTPQVSSIAQ